MYRAEGSVEKYDWSEAEGSYLNFIDGWESMLRPVVVVRAKVKLEFDRRGSRKVEVQPAPRIRRSISCILNYGGRLVVWSKISEWIEGWERY